MTVTMEHEHTPEVRERQHYDQSVIAAAALVCAECETFLGWLT